MRLFSVYQGVGNFRTLVSRISFSLFLSPFLRLSFPPAPSITRACNRAVAEHDFDFAEDKSQFVYVSFGERDRTPSCEGFGRRQDLPLLPILRISKAIPGLSPSLSLSVRTLPPTLFVFSSNPVSILHRSFASLPSRRLLHCAFALEVISKNFWRWIVPRDGNRRPTLPAAFTQTTGETTFPSVRATVLRLTISERNNIQNSRATLFLSLSLSLCDEEVSCTSAVSPRAGQMKFSAI